MHCKCFLYLILLFEFSKFQSSVSFDLLSVTIAAISSLFVSRCRYSECCDNNWIINDFHGLAGDFTTKLYGQHLVHNTILNLLRNHIRNENPRKALVLSFHGRTGSGKNHVVNLIVNRIFKEGHKSNFFKLWVAKRHFLHENRIEEYQDTVQETVRDMVKNCPRSVFVFDEADHLPRGVVDAIKPFLDYHNEIDGVDYRKSLFIFLSNTGSKDIAKVAYSFKEKSRSREEIGMTDIEPLIKKASFTEKGGLHESTLTENCVIDVYVPFLPLEKKHVHLCIKDYLEFRGCSSKKKLTEKVSDAMEYEPPELYSKTGCKTVESKIDILIDDDC